ncbi:peptide ABC transporter, membrane protein [Syntrophotalea carbinolica DSM 2380]|uniref:Peptide ABC transporter, membrane protein n=1 Tax=Syntrophotalea carbinolica (strain DSM 2380 / NBRC 103641 / GraBd1) TaxID=338963 RepID=Q3A3E7_SYNC1|nr:ABC transporter permease [Syntrophotalea carbinolica]ABA89110.1 peptide ABC transporter, membrane protein [Syntrophotalea carbinolica DSM 2380]
MLVQIAKRLIMMVPLLLGITLISFVVIHLAPGEPTDLQTQLNPEVSAELRQRLRAQYDLDQPLLVQYGKWLGRLARLDFGESFVQDRRPVAEKIAERLPVTLMINVLSIGLILLIAVPLGVLSAVRRNSLFDRFTTVFVFLGFATPSFWLALLLMDFFGVRLGLFPVAGLKSLGHEYLSTGHQIADVLHHLILPVFVSAFGGLAGFSRYMRGNMLEVIRQDYILTARAKGLSERVVVYRHALRNALLPVITILGLSIPGLIGGSVIFETIFAIPGMGKMFYDGVMMRDYPLIMGVLVIGAVLTLSGNLLADLAYAMADPRIRRR